MNTKKDKKWIVPIIIGVIGIGLTGYMLITNKKTSSIQSPPTPSPTIPAIPILTLPPSTLGTQPSMMYTAEMNIVTAMEQQLSPNNVAKDQQIPTVRSHPMILIGQSNSLV